MLRNVELASDLQALARRKANSHVFQTLNPLLVDDALEEGWTVERRLKKSVRLQKPKLHGTLLEDRVWTLLYRMGFCNLPGNSKAILELDPKDLDTPITELDCVAIDSEVAIAIECKSSARATKRTNFQEELGKFVKVRQPFAAAAHKQFEAKTKHQVGLAMFLSNAILSTSDTQRAALDNVVLFDEQELAYYEGLVAQIGVAARYQFLADMFPKKPIPGLNIRVPAIRAKMGGYTAYTFSMRPEYLLKIAYVSHRAKGKPWDIDTYQRMMRKSRLKSIQHYIDHRGVFPTNIVISFEKKPNFDRREQDGDLGTGTMGWLDIRAAYKSAWIIDGQHRLFAYSGHSRADSDRLSVLAFEDLPPSMQAQLFIDINAKQKSVKQSLLRELSAELHWNSDDPEARVGAIVAKAVLTLDEDHSSPFYGRIQTADDKKDETRCITFASLDGALRKPELFIQKTKRLGVLEYGPLWSGEDNEKTRRRTVFLVNKWFEAIRSSVPDWWDAGAGDGGGLAMNDSVTACVNVLRSVFEHVQSDERRLSQLENEDIWDRVQPYGSALGQYLASFSLEQRRQFRSERGVQGQVYRTKQCQTGIHERIPSFEPEGLAKFMATQKEETNIKAKVIVDRIESSIKRAVLTTLKTQYPDYEDHWWVEGVPKAVRVRVMKDREEDDGRHGDKENYFYLIDYRNIMLNKWEIFSDLFGQGKTSISKEKRTSWLNEVNDIRNLVAHPSAGRPVSLEQLELLREHDHWLVGQLLVHSG